MRKKGVNMKRTSHRQFSVAVAVGRDVREKAPHTCIIRQYLTLANACDESGSCTHKGKVGSEIEKGPASCRSAAVEQWRQMNTERTRRGQKAPEGTI